MWANDIDIEGLDENISDPAQYVNVILIILKPYCYYQGILIILQRTPLARGRYI